VCYRPRLEHGSRGSEEAAKKRKNDIGAEPSAAKCVKVSSQKAALQKRLQCRKPQV
jgi:hypothetical protein